VRVLQQGYRSQDWGLESSGVLEALGINTKIPVWKIDRSVAEAGIGFVFEPVISEVMGCLQFAFREIPVPTIFDLTLPLLNPGGAAGLVRVLELLEEELVVDMALLGVTRVDQITPTYVCSAAPVTFAHEMSAFVHIPGGQLR